MFQKFINYIKESTLELRKVVWPTRREALNHALTVIVISLGVAAFLGLIDFILTKVLELVIKGVS